VAAFEQLSRVGESGALSASANNTPCTSKAAVLLLFPLETRRRARCQPSWLRPCSCRCCSYGTKALEALVTAALVLFLDAGGGQPRVPTVLTGAVLQLYLLVHAELLLFLFVGAVPLLSSLVEVGQNKAP